MAKSKTARDGSRPPLTGIRLVGFKCFRDPVDVAVRPLTLLAGANSGGKSSLMQPLLLLKQTLEAQFDPGPLLLDGPLVRLEEAMTLFWKGKAATDRAKTWTVGLRSAAGGRKTSFSYGGKRTGLQLDYVETEPEGARLWVGMSRSDVDDWLRSHSYSFDMTVFEIVRQRSALALVGQAPGISGLHLSPGSDLDELCLDLIHLPGLRGNPQRAYPLTRARARFPGPFSPYTAGVLLGWKESNANELAAVGDDLRTLGLTWKVEPHQRGDVSVEVMIGRLPGPQQGGAQDTVNIADVGFGASQVLPVVVALQAARPGQVVHIEQPELHLHPRAQRAMAELLINAAKRGATVIVETHSHVLLTAVQLAVASGAMPAEDVALHWFERDAEGASHVRSAALDAAGAYGDWPVDFADVEMEVESAYIEAAFGKGTA